MMLKTSFSVLLHMWCSFSLIADGSVVTINPSGGIRKSNRKQQRIVLHLTLLLYDTHERNRHDRHRFSTAAGPHRPTVISAYSTHGRACQHKARRVYVTTLDRGYVCGLFSVSS